MSCAEDQNTQIYIEALSPQSRRQRQVDANQAPGEAA
jgi:hypothetical protein